MLPTPKNLKNTAELVLELLSSSSSLYSPPTNTIWCSSADPSSSSCIIYSLSSGGLSGSSLTPCEETSSIPTSKPFVDAKAPSSTTSSSPSAKNVMGDEDFSQRKEVALTLRACSSSSSVSSSSFTAPLLCENKRRGLRFLASVMGFLTPRKEEMTRPRNRLPYTTIMRTTANAVCSPGALPMAFSFTRSAARKISVRVYMRRPANALFSLTLYGLHSVNT
mmetsp:Transcript_42086/g.85091  ORF Transcript_42086/g.85091 Transcript_42086/m.85091 type:complete len:221 (-) Transcript_42086:1984-2646(-)